MEFTKMQGIGNDFILIDGFDRDIPEPAALARRLCHRRFGIGADGLILALPSDRADARMRIFNSDGSEPEMCGNGIRCLGRFLYDRGLCRRRRMTIDTLAGALTLSLTPGEGDDFLLTVDMGAPVLDPAAIPVDAPSNAITLDLEGRPTDFFCVSMGNPHAVACEYYPEEADFLRLGAMLEGHPVFPRRANIEFCRVLGPENMDMRVWERGDGPTLGCGTGACAAVVAASSLGLCRRKCAVHLPGGTLHILWGEDDHVMMTGPAQTVFTGEIAL